MKKIFFILILLCQVSIAEDLEKPVKITTLPAAVRQGPTWLFTVPTADVLPKDILSVGVIHLDLGVNPQVEAGIHGIKYILANYQDGGKLSLGISLVYGLLPYAVYTKSFDFGILSLGVNPFPYFVFVGLETKLNENASFIGEIHNGFTVGVRDSIAKNWYMDLGAGLTVYPYKNYVLYDFANTDYYYFKFPTTFSSFFVISISYLFNVSPPPVPEVIKEKKPSEEGIKPIDPINN